MSRNRDNHRKRMGKFSGPAFVQAVGAAMYECADTVRAEAHRSISAGSVSGKGHVPSAPGEPPNRDTGNLQSNIEVTQPRPLIARVTSKAGYSTALEFGTSTLSARPFMRPARDKKKPEAEALLKRRLAKFTKGK